WTVEQVVGGSACAALEQGGVRIGCGQDVGRVTGFRKCVGAGDTQVREALRVLAILLFALYPYKKRVAVDENESAASFNFVFLWIYPHHTHGFSHAIWEVVEACVDNVPIFLECLDNKLGKQCCLSSSGISHDQDNGGRRIALGEEFVNYSYPSHFS